MTLQAVDYRVLRVTTYEVTQHRGIVKKRRGKPWTQSMIQLLGEKQQRRLAERDRERERLIQLFREESINKIVSVHVTE